MNAVIAPTYNNIQNKIIKNDKREFRNMADNELDELMNNGEKAVVNQLTIHKNIISHNSFEFENYMDINVNARRKDYMTKNVRFDMKSNKPDNTLESGNISDSDKTEENNVESKIKLSNDNMAIEIDSKSKILSNCWSLDKFEPTQLIVKLKRFKCTRRAGFEDGFLMMMTDILNKYVDSPFQFNKEITEVSALK